MPVPVGPRRAAPPRKKAASSAPAIALPEPPVEEAESVTIPSPPIIDDQPPASVDRIVHDLPLTTRGSQVIAEVAEVALTASDKDLHTTADAEQLTVQPASTDAFHEPAKEPQKQEAEEELIEGADSHVEEGIAHTIPDDQQVSSENPPEVDEEDEEARRHHVAAKLAQMGAINPLTGPHSIPQRPSFDEPAPAQHQEPLDVEDEVNVDTEEHEETIPSPSIIPSRPLVADSIKLGAVKPHLEPDQDDGKLDEDRQVSTHRDGEF